MDLLIRNARILTLAGAAGPRRGAALGELGVIPRGDVRIAQGKIQAVGRDLPAAAGAEVIEANGRVLMPGFVDCHTHACWAGDRLDEWEQKRRGVPYLEILRAGGGIHSTVRAVRAASEATLMQLLGERLANMLRGGTTTAEVKSGYGLSTEAELKMLRAIQSTPPPHQMSVVATALLGHAVEGDPATFFKHVIGETLPAVTQEFPGIAVDAFCEDGAWTREACVQLLRRAKELGHPLRIHTDQFHSFGMVVDAVALGARTVDHLEATTAEDFAALARSNAIGVILPGTGFHTDARFAPVRKFVDEGGALAIATNYNPGSSPTHSMPFALSLAVRHCGVSPAEAIAAGTVNAAAALGLNDRGTLEIGNRADLILLHHRDERMLVYEVGSNPVDLVICDGKVV